MVAIFADHQQWQRAFAVKEGLLIPVYWGAAMLHGYVTFLLGTLGILIFQSNYHSSGSMEMVGINFIQSNYPGIFVVIFVTMALCALISTLDSGLCAFSSLWLTDASKRSPALARGRLIMLLHAAAGILVALVHLPLITLWFMAGTIRLATFAPTVLSIIQPNFSGS
jgi:Na+/proline symporter